MSLSQDSQDEICAVSSIFYDLIKIESDHTILCSFPHEIDIRFTIGSDYPEKSPPTLEICAPSISGEIKTELRLKLENICNEKLGEAVLYDCIQAAKEFIDSLKFETTMTRTSSQHNKDSEIRESSKEASIKVPQIYGTDTLSDRKSVFQAHIARINSKDEAMAVLQELMSNTKIARATHRIYAYRTYVVKKGQKLPLYDHEDDGETGAGIKLQHLLQIMKIDNVMVVVTRWYGGVHLGADRFRHILNKARQAILESGIGKQ